MAVAVVALTFMTLSNEVSAGASSLSTVTFNSTAPTSLVANTASTWTVGFTTSASGQLASSSTITVTFPAGFTTASTSPTIVLQTPTGSGKFATNCIATGSDASKSNVVVISLSNASGQTCPTPNALPSSTAATLTIAMINGSAGAYGGTNFSVATSSDTTAVAPAVGATITTTSVTAVSVTSTAPTSLVKAAASTWTWSFTTSSTGSLSAGSTIQLTFPSGFTTISTTPTVALTSPGTFPTNCTATASDPSENGAVVITLANNGANTCLLANSTAAKFTIGVANGTTDVLTTLFLSTSKDATLVSPTGTAPTLTAATNVTAVSFTTVAPTSLVAYAASVWTVNLTTTGSGALASGGYIVATFPTGFTTSSTTPTIVLTSPAAFSTSCTPTGSDPTKSNVIVINLTNIAGHTCALAASTAGTITIAVVNGPAGTDAASTYSVHTSNDGTATSPASGSETIVSAGPPGTGTNWTLTSPASPGEARAAGAPGAPSALQGAASGNFMCASSTSEVVDLSWNSVSNATSYVIEQASSANGTYAVASPAPVFSGNSATITYTTAVTEYYEVEAVIGSAWTSSLVGGALNGSVTPGYVVLATTAPKCTNN